MKLLEFRNYIEAALQLVLPDRCRVCGRFTAQSAHQALCSKCLQNVHFISLPTCQSCGRSLGGVVLPGQHCAACLSRQPPWTRCISLVRYGSPVSELLHRLKYQADTSVLPAVRTIVAEAVADTQLANLSPPELVVPVPLHPVRLKERGLNQSVLLAKAIFPSSTLSCSVLYRQRATIPQTGLTGAQRRRNLRGAFVVDRKAALAGKTIYLVDDVFTTGTTVGECCRALKRSGATEIYVVTLARVVADH